MQTLNLYAMYDKKSECYDTPFWQSDHIHAKRKFIMAINSIDSMVSQFKDDFEVHFLGTFNMTKGEFNELGNDPILKGSEIQTTLPDKE